MRTETRRDWREYLGIWGWLLGPALLLAGVMACVPPRPPKPPVPPGPPAPFMRTVQSTIRGTGLIVPAASLLTDDAKRVPCDTLKLSDGTPRVVCTLDPATPNGWQGHLTVTAKGFDSVSKDFVLAQFTAEHPDQDIGEILLHPARKDLPRLVSEGQHVGRADGTPITLIEHTDFNLLGRAAAGEDITPILQERAHPWGDARPGFNLLRVFTAYDVCATGAGCQPIGRLKPLEHPDLYTSVLPALADKWSTFDGYLEVVAFTGPYGSIFSNDDEKVAHWEAIKALACSRSDIVPELVNEGDHPANSDLPWARLTPPTCGVLASHGSATQDATPMQPFWGIVTFHPAGSEWQRKSGHNAMELWDGPSYSNETVRFPDNDSNCQHAFDAAAGNTLLSAGGDYHTVSGKNSAHWNATELACARSFVEGARSVPLECQAGGYRHRDDLEGPNVLRAYQRGSDARCIVLIRP